MPFDILNDSIDRCVIADTQLLVLADATNAESLIDHWHAAFAVARPEFVKNDEKCASRKLFAQMIASLDEKTVLSLCRAQKGMLTAAKAVNALFLDESAALLGLVKAGTADSRRFSRKQVFSLLCAAWFGFLPDISRLDFFPLWFKAVKWGGAEITKLQMIANYFARISSMDDEERRVFDAQYVYITRVVVDEVVDWAACQKPLPDVRIEVARGMSIESCVGAAQADFANKFIGGGVLSGGSVQEEIRFACCPEALVALAIHAPMADNESILLRGTEQFSTYQGYGRRLQYGGSHKDLAGVDEVRQCIDVLIVAIDANDYRHGGAVHQYASAHYNRELTKLFAGLTAADRPSFATGNWGCGVFLGDLRHKFVLQWMACAATHKALVYYPFGERGAEEDLAVITSALHGKTVADAYRLLQCYEKNPVSTFTAFVQAQETI